MRKEERGGLRDRTWSDGAGAHGHHGRRRYCFSGVVGESRKKGEQKK
jgi:hypothetical protein